MEYVGRTRLINSDTEREDRRAGPATPWSSPTKRATSGGHCLGGETNTRSSSMYDPKNRTQLGSACLMIWQSQGVTLVAIASIAPFLLGGEQVFKSAGRLPHANLLS